MEWGLWSAHYMFFPLLRERNLSPAPAWGASHRRQLSMNFSSVNLSHRQQFSRNCCNVGHYSFRHSLFHCGSPMKSQVLPGDLLWCEFPNEEQQKSLVLFRPKKRSLRGHLIAVFNILMKGARRGSYWPLHLQDVREQFKSSQGRFRVGSQEKVFHVEGG